MDPSKADAMYGKYFDFPVLDNDDIRVESAGHYVAVGFKSKLKKIICTLKLEHPFDKNYTVPTGCKWDMTIEEATKHEIKISFRQNNTLHMLILVCTDPDMKIKPIEVTWT